MIAAIVDDDFGFWLSLGVISFAILSAIALVVLIWNVVFLVFEEIQERVRRRNIPKVEVKSTGNFLENV